MECILIALIRAGQELSGEALYGSIKRGWMSLEQRVPSIRKRDAENLSEQGRPGKGVYRCWLDLTKKGNKGKKACDAVE